LLTRLFCAALSRAAGVRQSAAAPIRHFSPLAVLPVLALVLAPVMPMLNLCGSAAAHEIAGNRFFPATLAIDDPGVNDELAMPTVTVTKGGDEPPVKELDISGEYAKRLTESLAISVAPTWTHLYTPGGPAGNGASGFQNLETTLKYRFYRDAEHELVMSAGLSIDWGGSGASGVGADGFATYTPTLYFGKGFGDLPDEMWLARPIALTGTVGYSVPGTAQSIAATIDNNGNATTSVERHPQFVNWGLSLQYGMPYLKSAVYDAGLPDIVNHLIPIVEASFQTPAASLTSPAPISRRPAPSIRASFSSPTTIRSGLKRSFRSTATAGAMSVQWHNCTSISTISFPPPSASRCSAGLLLRRVRSEV
jgi:hypothetical protein